MQPLEWRRGEFLISIALEKWDPDIYRRTRG
jgi:hypothetical protein